MSLVNDYISLIKEAEDKSICVDGIAKRVIEVSYDRVEGWLIPPGESMRAYPSNVKQLRVRCRKGKATIVIHVLPE